MERENGERGGKGKVGRQRWEEDIKIVRLLVKRIIQPAKSVRNSILRFALLS